MSVLVLSILSSALIDTLAKSQTLSSSAQNQMLATIIAHQVLARAKHLTYRDLYTMQGCRTLDTSGNTLANADVADYFSPFVLDQSANWSPAALRNQFIGTISETIEPHYGDYSLKITARCSWMENGQTRAYAISTFVHANATQ